VREASGGQRVGAEVRETLGSQRVGIHLGFATSTYSYTILLIKTRESAISIDMERRRSHERAMDALQNLATRIRSDVAAPVLVRDILSISHVTGAGFMPGTGEVAPLSPDGEIDAEPSEQDEGGVDTVPSTQEEDSLFVSEDLDEADEDFMSCGEPEGDFDSNGEEDGDHLSTRSANWLSDLAKHNVSIWTLSIYLHSSNAHLLSRKDYIHPPGLGASPPARI
jgi:hypothetical protein